MFCIRIIWNLYRLAEFNAELSHEISRELVAVDKLELATVHRQFISNVKVLDGEERVVIRRRSTDPVTTNYRT